MKSKYAILASAFLISVTAFAQKDQIKAAEKALKGGNSSEAVSILQGAETLIPNATDGEKAQYFFVKGNALLDLANKNVEEGKNLSLAAKAYQDLLAVEKASGKDKYSSQAQASIKNIKEKLVNNAIENATQKKYKEASDLLYLVYELDKTDLEKLYYSASYAVNAQDFDTALVYYFELKKQNFSGEGIAYYAKNLITEKEDFFGATPDAKADRDSRVKLKIYFNPRDEKIPSKRGEVYKNIALILNQKGRTDEAKSALTEARLVNPDDVSLMLTEADLYLKLEDFVTYKKLISEALERNPNDADLIFNLGVISANSKNRAEAEKYYKRAIEIDPQYTNAYINVVALKLEDEKPINDEMAKLSTTAKDMKRYEVLKTQKDNLWKSTIPYLQKAIELEPTNVDVTKTLLSVYSALEMMPEAKALKEKIKEQEGK